MSYVTQTGGVFPPKKPKNKGSFGTRPPLGVRVPDDLEEYIETVMQAGYRRTDAVLRMLYIAYDLAETLDSDTWLEIEKRAHSQRTRPGYVIGQLARAALLSEPGPRSAKP